MPNTDLLNIAIAEEVYRWTYVGNSIWKDVTGEHRTLPNWAGDLLYSVQLIPFVRSRWSYRVKIEGPRGVQSSWWVKFIDTQGGLISVEDELPYVLGTGQTLEEALVRGTLAMAGVTVDD